MGRCRSRPDDAGQVMPLAVAAVVFAGLILIGLGTAGRAITERTQARTAADAAALAGAAEGEAAARRLAEAHDAELVELARSGNTVVVEVELRGTVARASARTVGPGPAGGRRDDTEGGDAPPLATVEGITVHRDIAPQVEALVREARTAGFELTGGGYRSPQQQVGLRRRHCGTSRHAVYEMPAAQCTPPTARPGTSLHERGLAVDLSCNGALVRSRTSDCFRWLADNGPGFGLHNLPSEPWHWSTTGQ